MEASKMSKQQIKDKIQHLEMEIFILEMKDQLDSCDRSLISEYQNEIKRLKEFL